MRPSACRRIRGKARWLAMAAAILELDGVVKRYGSALGVGPVSLDVAEGEFLTLLGPSGCGKTTTLHIIAGLLQHEPLSNLDALLRKRMRLELRDIQRRLGITTIFVTHDQEEAFEMSDRVALLNAGRIEQLGAPEDLYNDPASRFAAEFIGEA